jgi:hypothetical protein
LALLHYLHDVLADKHCLFLSDEGHSLQHYLSDAFGKRDGLCAAGNAHLFVNFLVCG